jgi:hypothetical protein
MEPTKEKMASQTHRFKLPLSWDGKESATVYFDIESDEENDPSWLVSEGFQIFYRDTEITLLFDPSDIEELIYCKDALVNQQIEDHRINDMDEYYHPYDD